MIRCFITDCSPLEDTVPYSRAYALLSDSRRDIADGYRFMKDRVLSVTAGLFMRAVEDSYGKITVDANGKPHAPGIGFNVSHSGHYVAFACSDRPVGIDIEGIGRNMDIAERVMTPAEYSDFNDYVNECDREHVFIRMWTAKESYMKALGLGFRLPPESFRVLYGYELRGPDKNMALHELEAPQGYCATVCSADDEVSCVRLDVEDLMDSVSGHGRSLFHRCPLDRPFKDLMDATVIP
jgi:4'-phosphopantetheinyl transferase